MYIIYLGLHIHYVRLLGRRSDNEFGRDLLLIHVRHDGG